MLLLLPSELIPVCWANIWAENEYLNYCHKCFLLFLMGIWDVVVFFRDTVHCKLYSLNSSSRRTTLLFLHGQTETERTWAARLTSSAISSHCGTLLITCALMSIWSFCCFFFSCSALLSVVIILVLQQGAFIGKVRNKEGRRKYFQQTSEREKANGWLDVAADRCQKVFAGVNEKEDSKEKRCRLIILNVFWISVF